MESFLVNGAGAQVFSHVFPHVRASVLTPADGIVFDPDAQAYFTAVGLTDPAYTIPINAAIVALKAANLWTKTVRFWLTGNKDATAALTCWKSLVAMTPVNAPTFAAGRGYTGNGSTSYLNTNFNESTDGGGIYLRDSASRVTYVRNNRTTDADTAVCGLINSGFNAGGNLIPRFSGGNTWSNINANYGASQNNGAYAAGTRGLWTEVRSDSLTMRLDFNGSQVAIKTNATSTALQNRTPFLLARAVDATPQFFSTDEVFFHGYFGALNSTESTALNTIISDLVTALGA